MGWYLSRDQLEKSQSVYNLDYFNSLYSDRISVFHKIAVYTLGFLRQLTLIATVIAGFGYYVLNVDLKDVLINIPQKGVFWSVIMIMTVMFPLVWILATIYAVLKGREKGGDEHKMLSVYDTLVNSNRDGIVLVPLRRLSVWSGLISAVIFGLTRFLTIKLSDILIGTPFADFCRGINIWSRWLFILMLVMYIWHYMAFIVHGDDNLFMWLIKSYWIDISSLFSYFFNWRTLDISIVGRILGIAIRVGLITVFVIGAIMLV